MKNYLVKTVLEASVERLEYVFDNFEKVYFSFSGGKDSTVMMHLAHKVASQRNRLPLNVLFVDLESQYASTIKHVEEIMTKDWVNPYWVCLPFNLRNAVSMFQPQWQCWNIDEREKWVREYPKYDWIIKDVNYFDFFEVGMEFEQFVIKFAKWFGKDKKTACGVGIRTDESINRFRTLVRDDKVKYDNKNWTTRIIDNVYNFYPIYDWRTEDIWTFIGKENLEYNRIYDLMYQAGKSIHECRICQPYGDDQRKGLNLFKVCEPETWSKVVSRVSGANLGNIYCESIFLGHRKIILPEGHTWKTFFALLYNSLPRFLRFWYAKKFKVYFKWYRDHGIRSSEFYDATPKGIKGDVPSYERLCKAIIKNDYLCKSLSFGQIKNAWDIFNEMRSTYGS